MGKQTATLVRNGSAPVLNSASVLPSSNGLPHVLSSKDVSRIWSNDDINVRQLQAANLLATSSAALPGQVRQTSFRFWRIFSTLEMSSILVILNCSYGGLCNGFLWKFPCGWVDSSCVLTSYDRPQCVCKTLIIKHHLT